MRITEFRPLQRNSLLGFATVEMPSGMILHDCGVYQKEGNVWASPPSKPMIGRDGAKVTDRDGRAVYKPIIEFTTKDVRDKWSTAVIDALRQSHPDVLNPPPQGDT